MCQCRMCSLGNNTHTFSLCLPSNPSTYKNLLFKKLELAHIAILGQFASNFFRNVQWPLSFLIIFTLSKELRDLGYV